MKNKKRNLIVIALGIGMLCIGIGSALAYLTTTANRKTNMFSFLKPMVLVKVLETDAIGEPIEPDYVNLGSDQKNVQLENPDDPTNGFFVADTVNRVMFVPMFKEGTYGTEGVLGDLTAPVENKIEMSELVLHFTPGWENDWFFKEGYFYYKYVLEAGNKTPILLTGVTLNPGNGLGNRELQLEVLADAIETDSNLVSMGWNLILDETGLHQ